MNLKRTNLKSECMNIYETITAYNETLCRKNPTYNEYALEILCGKKTLKMNMGKRSDAALQPSQ